MISIFCFFDIRLGDMLLLKYSIFVVSALWGHSDNLKCQSNWAEYVVMSMMQNVFYDSPDLKVLQNWRKPIQSCKEQIALWEKTELLGGHLYMSFFLFFRSSIWPSVHPSIRRALYLRNCASCDQKFWYTHVKWWYLQVFFPFFGLLGG